MAEPLKPRRWGHTINPDDSFGTWLRRQREVREISLREIAESSKISIRYLEALEQDRFDILPAPVFAKGFLREYASFVGLDADEVINYFLAAQGKQAADSGPAEETRRREPTSNSYAWYLVGGLILIFALVALLSWFLNREEPADGGRPAMAAPPVIETPSTATDVEPAPAARASVLEVTLDFTQNCWVEAFVDGERARSELRVQGESLRLQGEEEVRLTLGNVAGATIEVNGHPYESGAKNGEVIEIDAALARSLAEGDPTESDG